MTKEQLIEIAKAGYGSFDLEEVSFHSKDDSFWITKYVFFWEAIKSAITSTT